MKNKLILTLCLCASVVISFAQNEITLEDIWTKGTFSAKGVSGFQSMKDGRYYCAQDDNENIIRYSFASGKAIDTLVKSAELKLKGFSYSWSSDESKLLLQTNFKQIYRHSFAANVFVFDIKTRKVVQPITEQVMLAEFSPDATKIAYVKDHNLFCFDLNTGKEIQITQDGKTNAIINGATDWVYEEEFALSKGFYWSPDGTMLAYYRFDESEVKEFGMSMYGKLYPEEYKFKYPKAGEANSVIEIYIYHIPTNKKQKIDIGSETDIYIPRVNWARSNTLMIQRMNRLQNKLDILLANARNGKSDIIYTEENKAYIEVPEIHLPADGKTFILNSEKSGWNHFYQYDFSGKLIRQLTSGNWDVDQFYGIDEKKKLFYISTSEINSTERYVYACSMDGKTRKQLTKRKGWNSATFNADYSYFLLNQSAIHQPPYYALCDASGKEVRVLEDNQLLKERLTKYDLTTAEITNYKNAYGESLNAFMMKPKIFDATKKYPVLMYVYGGPGHQLAVNRWMGGNYFWYQLLAAKGYMIVCVDGRGTGFKGEAFKKSTYLQLGKYEIEDQIFVAKELGKLPYIDAGRIGIWGWSFGGYMASLGISKGADVFKTAIAVAPVTNWRYYDNIYTERFMRTPQENGKSYDDNSPMNHVEKIKGNYLIIHGTADDNVHFQNAVEMVNTMINKGVNFDSEFYPNKNHGIGGAKTRLHLYERMTRFILEKL
ncbi:MAG: S9 family peptidase [Sphingobacteriales bacterium]|nr:S9 family peptidase [Sphingobacteriales bacterium]